MTDKNTQKTKIFDDKIKALIADYQKLKEDNRLLRRQADAAKNDCKIAHKEFVDLQKEYQHFRMAASLSGSSNAEKTEMRAAIEKLVRETDTCLKLLNN
ncbi:MAG: hypothetical protein LBS01_06580 [Prevotellaceae bacterium]|jgi:hypothetical protein|nr:hypothetical protein [Prevotellaceae bacterium]